MHLDDFLARPEDHKNVDQGNNVHIVSSSIYLLYVVDFLYESSYKTMQLRILGLMRLWPMMALLVSRRTPTGAF
jgi:hypothetical protein